MIPTVGCVFMNLRIKTKYGMAKLCFWDSAGGNFIISLRSYFRGFQCFVLCYDITDKKSFESIKNVFYNEIYNNLGDNLIKNALIYLVGNKIDLKDEIQVPDEEAISFANEKKMLFFKVSAKTGEGLDNLKSHMLHSLVKKFGKNKTVGGQKKKNFYSVI